MTFHLTAIADGSAAIRYSSGAWSVSTSSALWGRTDHASSKTGATATYTFTGRAFAWVAPRSAIRGKATISVGGVVQATIDLYAASLQPNRIVWSKQWSTSATRTVVIKVLGTVGRPRFDVDGFLVGS